jgi:4-hydroxy-tetrahydrodipicolinate reductase
MPVRAVISGATGRMGHALVALIETAKDFTVAGGINRERRSAAGALKFGFEAIETAESAAGMIEHADVVLDFSAPEGLQSLLTERARELQGKALVVGTTGLNSDILRLLAQASHKSPVIVSANYSIGVNLMLGVVAAAAKVLTPDRFDVEIVETHHRHKADAPSGTALMLGRAIADARNSSLEKLRRDGRTGKSGERPTGEIGFHALRGGEVAGEHAVHFLGARERFEIVHAASDRYVFAEGALSAARWLVKQKPGSYSMKDVLGI